MFANIYKGRRILITGHTGFKGSWLSAWLIALGADVSGFSLDVPTTPSNFEALDLASRIQDLRGDIRNFAEVEQAIEQSKPEIIFHLAAQALVRRSYNEPAATFNTNVNGTLNILEAVRQNKDVAALVIITSDKCYRNNEWVWGYRETDRLGGSDPYSASKGCAELVAHSYMDSYFQTRPACATARAGNVIGGGDWAEDRIVPDCARAWFANKPVEIRSPNATRPWQHVLEPLSGYLWLGAKLLQPDLPCPGHPAGQSYNFGPPADVNNPVAEVVKSLTRYWSGFQQIMDLNDCAGKKECGLLKLCCDKALADLDWKATLCFDETIRYTAEWYSRYHAGAHNDDMWRFTQGQIDAYTNAAQERGLLWAKL